VPLCRDHHWQLHHRGNEVAWRVQQIAPLQVQTILGKRPCYLSTAHRLLDLGEPERVDTKFRRDIKTDEGSGFVS
jgi:hypothetical protein